MPSFKKDLFLIMGQGYVRTCARGQPDASDPLELELHAVVSSLMFSAGDRNPVLSNFTLRALLQHLNRCLEGSLLCAHLKVYKSEEVREAKLLEQGILMAWRREDGSTICALGIKPKFSGEAASVLNC